MKALNTTLETQMRRKAIRLGFRVSKGRGAVHANNHGGYQIIDDRNVVVAGVDFDIRLDALDHWLDHLAAGVNRFRNGIPAPMRM